VFATVDGTVKFEHSTRSKKRIRVEAAETARRPLAAEARPD
jgi:ribosomal protein L27